MQGELFVVLGQSLVGIQVVISNTICVIIGDVVIRCVMAEIAVVSDFEKCPFLFEGSPLKLLCFGDYLCHVCENYYTSPNILMKSNDYS